MTVKEFMTYWNTEYTESALYGYKLRTIYPDRWFRIHSLPNSKRYADNEADYKIILNRQNQLMSDLLGEETEFAILFELSEDDINYDYYKKLFDFDKFTNVSTVKLMEEESDQYFDVYVKIEKWRNGKMNRILKSIADDEIRAMFISPSKKWIIAPYDGGVDVIVDTTKKRDQLKVKYKNWLSDREDGL